MSKRSKHRIRRTKLWGALLLGLAAGCTPFEQADTIVILRDTDTAEKMVTAIADRSIYRKEISSRQQTLDGSPTAEAKATAEAELEALTTVSADLGQLHQFAVLSAGVYKGNSWRPKTLCPFEAASQWVWQNETGALPLVSELPAPRGFDLEIWSAKRQGVKPLVVLVFRGTDSTSISDWLSNLRWVLPFIRLVSTDQYEYTIDVIPGLVAEISSKYKETGVEIMAAGHSLGGGLAQQAGYTSPVINTVYAFASSPVTGFYSIESAERKKNKLGMHIYCVFEHGEILAYVRWFMKGLLPVAKQDPKIVEARYNLFTDDDPVGQHSMRNFACRLQAIADKRNMRAQSGG